MVFDRERNRALNVSRAVPGPDHQHADTLLLWIAAFQLIELIQIFNPYFGYSNSWSTNLTNNFFKKNFKIKRIKDGVITF